MQLKAPNVAQYCADFLTICAVIICAIGVDLLMKYQQVKPIVEYLLE